jgi:hypothetical protein
MTLTIRLALRWSVTLTLVGVIAWVVAGCSANSPIGTGFEAHDMDLVIPNAPGITAPGEYRWWVSHDCGKVEVWSLRADHTMTLCRRHTNSDAMGCTLSREDMAPMRSFPFSENCLAFVTRSKVVYEHELKHCFEGSWH